MVTTCEGVHKHRKGADCEQEHSKCAVIAQFVMCVCSQSGTRCGCRREEQMEERAVREAWTLDKSVFRPRVKEADAHNYTDTPACLTRMFDADWKRACGKEKFSSMLVRENKSNKVCLSVTNPMLVSISQGVRHSHGWHECHLLSYSDICGLRV